MRTPLGRARMLVHTAAVTPETMPADDPHGATAPAASSVVARSVPWEVLHAAVAVFLCVALPGGSYLWGEGIFAWNMFSKSETYRLTIIATMPDASTREIDARALGPRVGPELAGFLPAPREWRHEPVGLTFRTALPLFAALACRQAPGATHVDATLDERADLDAPTRPTTARATCR